MMESIAANNAKEVQRLKDEKAKEEQELKRKQEKEEERRKAEQEAKRKADKKARNKILKERMEAAKVVAERAEAEIQRLKSEKPKSATPTAKEPTKLQGGGFQLTKLPFLDDTDDDLKKNTKGKSSSTKRSLSVMTKAAAASPETTTSTSGVKKSTGGAAKSTAGAAKTTGGSSKSTEGMSIIVDLVGVTSWRRMNTNEDHEIVAQAEKWRSVREIQSPSPPHGIYTNVKTDLMTAKRMHDKYLKYTERRFADTLTLLAVMEGAERKALLKPKVLSGMTENGDAWWGDKSHQFVSRMALLQMFKITYPSESLLQNASMWMPLYDVLPSKYQNGTSPEIA